MHSYLIVSNNQAVKTDKVLQLVKKLKLSPFEFCLEKIQDVRNLSSFTKLNFNKPTAVIVPNIDKATTEALNAFLKNLEEPQKNITYILTASSIHAVLPTISSRCQIIYINSTKGQYDIKLLNSFVKDTASEKLSRVSEIKSREEAIDFIQDLIKSARTTLYSKKVNYKKAAKFIKSAAETLNSLKANGNVNLQLTNFVLSLE